MAVEFDEEKYSYENRQYPTTPKNTPVMNLFIKAKLAKTPAQANAVMIVVCLICIVLTIIIIKSVL